MHDPRTGLKTLAAKLDVYQHDEEGLQSIALDPNLQGQRVDLPVLLAAAQHAGRRSGDAHRQ
jgi:cytochrome c